MLLQLAIWVYIIIFSQDNPLQTHPNHWVSGISKARGFFKPGQDNVNTLQLRTESDPHSSLILTYFVPVKMSDPLSESYSARATPAKTSEIDPRQKFLGWLHFYLEAAERVQPTLDWVWLRVCWISSPRLLLCLQILSLPRDNQRPKLEEDAS